MRELTSLDLYFVKQELMNLIGAKVDKIYQPDENTLILQLHKEGKQLIKVILPNSIFLAKEKSAGRQLNFSIFLRKHLSNCRLTSIVQKDFERILELEFQLNDKRILIIELFSKGNIIFCDSSYNIISALKEQTWKDRTIKKNELYKYPPAKTNPFDLSLNRLAKAIIESKKDSIVKTLAIDLSFSGIYAEEICLASNIDKNKIPINDLEIKNIYATIQKIKNLKINPNAINHEAFPFELKLYENKEKVYFPTFSEAIEENIAYQPPRLSKEKEKLTKLLEIQKKQLEHIKLVIEEETEKANLIYNNYQLINSLLQQRDLDKMKQDSLVKEINKKDKTFTMALKGSNLTLNINQSIDVNASFYYEKAKRMKHKLAGAEKAITMTLEKLKKSDIIEVKKEKPAERKREWYEKFRWFISSDGFLVISGRDATTNDIIVKKHLEKNDLVFHTELKGSPFVVIKSNNNLISQNTIEEAAIFCAANSMQWSAKLAASDVYYVGPDQLKKELGLPKGTFMIHGKRTYLKPVLQLAIGVTNDTKIMCAPINAVKSNCKNMIIIKQGDMKKSDIAKKIKKRFEDELKIKINLDEIMQALPPGECSI
ncbi:NFACT family protein [Candidatus Woesearchaeota archaeon]|nr:NFACT family protein [Candidatus Woesearchaeota archaeon]